MLLIGIGGSGRQSLSRIASYMCELTTFQISVTKHYGLSEFREDLKSLYLRTGVDNRATSFLFNDTQVIEEQFLEIINSILSTGEVANLYKSEEFEDVSDDVSNFIPASLVLLRSNLASLYSAIEDLGRTERVVYKFSLFSEPD